MSKKKINFMWELCMATQKITCSVCAWRENCKKKYSVIDPSKCIDFTRDVTIKSTDEKDDTGKN